jgi:hypothetical protein
MTHLGFEIKLKKLAIFSQPGSVAEMRAPNLRQSSQVKNDRWGKI